MGLGAVLLGLLFIVFLFSKIIIDGSGAFQQSRILLDIDFSEQQLDPAGERDPAQLATANYAALVKSALRAKFPEVKGRSDKRSLYKIISSGGAYQLREIVLADPSLIGSRQQLWLTADDDIDMLVKGHIDRTLPEAERRLSDKVIGWIEQLEREGAVMTRFNLDFISGGDSREPELAGIGGAVMGSFYTLTVTLLLAFPIGVGAAIYLEEFAPRNRWTDLVEININNLAAVPSIVFGLLGLAIYINFFGLPRSAPLVGGLVLTLMTLPTIIISSRAALKRYRPPFVKRPWV